MPEKRLNCVLYLTQKLSSLSSFAIGEVAEWLKAAVC
jgi:hypothetical protein